MQATGSDSDRALTAAIRKGSDILVPDVVRLELLAGAADEAAAHDLRRLMARGTPVPAASPADHDVAAALYRTARRSGRTVRSLLACLVAAVALRVERPSWRATATSRCSPR